MNADEQQINDALRALDDAHRHQQIQRDEYRQRRRVLIESMAHDTAATGDTVRRAMPSGHRQPPDMPTDGRDGAHAERAEERAARRDFAARPLAACAVLLGVVAASVVLFCWFAFG